MHDMGLIRGHIANNVESTSSGREGENIGEDMDKWLW